MRKGPFRSLTKRRDFDAVFKAGASQASKYLVFYAKPNELNICRLGLSVSKKVGKAVTRNRLKRLLREAMRKGLRDFAPSFDFVLIARRTSTEAVLDDFIRDIERFLLKLRHEKSPDIIHKAL